MIILSNGKRVANFSSPHPFEFTDGSILEAVSNEKAENLKITFHESVDTNGDVRLSFSLSVDVIKEVAIWQQMWNNNSIDVVFCPLPMITALRESGYDLKFSPFRSIRVEDRIKKLVSIEKQCI